MEEEISLTVVSSRLIINDIKQRERERIGIKYSIARNMDKEKEISFPSFKICFARGGQIWIARVNRWSKTTVVEDRRSTAPLESRSRKIFYSFLNGEKRGKRGFSRILPAEIEVDHRGSCGALTRFADGSFLPERGRDTASLSSPLYGLYIIPLTELENPWNNLEDRERGRWSNWKGRYLD